MSESHINIHLINRIISSLAISSLTIGSVIIFSGCAADRCCSCKSSTCVSEPYIPADEKHPFPKSVVAPPIVPDGLLPIPGLKRAPIKDHAESPIKNRIASKKDLELE